MTVSFWAIDYLCVALVLVCGGLVVVLPNLSGSVMALSAMGTVLSVLFPIAVFFVLILVSADAGRMTSIDESRTKMNAKRDFMGPSRKIAGAT